MSLRMRGTESFRLARRGIINRVKQRETIILVTLESGKHVKEKFIHDLSWGYSID